MAILTRDFLMGSTAVALAMLYALLRGIAYLLSYKLTCSLCHGKLLHSGPAHKHREAKRIPLLGWVWPVMLGTLFLGRFFCMYCGTPFRLRK